MNINDFIGHVGKHGIAKTNRFKVFIPKPYGVSDSLYLSDDGSRNLQFTCEAIDFPGRNFTTTDNRIYGAAFKTPYGTDYSEITLTLLCSADFREKQFFDDWMEYINPTNSFDFQYRDDYTVDMNIIQLSEKGMDDIQFNCNLIEAYPIAVNALSASWGDDAPHRVQVTMTYRYWVSDDNKLKSTKSGPTSR